MATKQPTKDIEKLTLQLQSKQLEVNSLLEVTQAINNNLPAGSLFKIYEFILRAQMGVDKLAVFLKEGEEWNCIIQYGTDGDLETVVVERDLAQYQKLTELKNGKNDKLKEFDIVIPVSHDEKPLAYTLFSGLDSESLSTKDQKIKFVQTITNIILVAIENKRLFKQQLEQEGVKREFELAAQVQAMLIPDSLPNSEKVSMSAVYLPHKEVGGDYYDCFMLNEEEMVFCVADISGKGIAAALLMANFQATLRALVKQNLTLEIFIHLLNENVNQITHGDKFITMFLAKYNMSNKMFTYVNAGHNPPLLLDGKGISQLEKGCTILGMFEELPIIQVGEIVLESNTRILCYTDGLTDLEDEGEDHFEIERLHDFMEENKDLNPADFNEKLLNKVIDFKGERLFVDDITILTCVLH